MSVRDPSRRDPSRRDPSRRDPSRRDVLRLGAGLALPFAEALPAQAAALEATAAQAPPRFRRGVNTWPWFDLTREYPAPRTDYAWPPWQPDRAVPRPADLARLAAAGFDFIRIPVDPGPYLAADPERRRILLDQLLGAVRMADAAGLGSVVNLQPNEATHFWTSQTLIAAPDAPEFAAYRTFVGTVAGELGRLRFDRLALEPVNEPPQQCFSSLWGAVQVALLESARAAAPGLTLVATGSCGSMVSGLEALDPHPLARFEPLLFTFHFYEPYLFSHQGAPWMREPVYRSLNAVPWPGSAGSLDDTLAAVRARMQADGGRTPEVKREVYGLTQRLMRQYFEADPDRRFLDHYLDRVTAWAAAHGIPADRIVMGEFGAVKTTGPILAAHPADRVRYVRDVREAAEAQGFGWAFWNLFDSMGLMDDASHAFDPAILDALGVKMPPM